MKVSREYLCKKIFDCLCVIGCLYQIQNVVSSYFKFSTVTRNRCYRPDVLQYPDLHYCFMLIEDMINVSSVNSKYGISIDKNNITSLYSLLDIVSVQDMLEFSPDGNITDCLYRDSTGNDIVPEDERSCNEFFKVKKYITQQYVCYAVRARKQTELSFWSIGKSLDYDRMIYEVRLPGMLAKSRKIRPTITTYKYPYVENVYAPFYYKTPSEDVAIQLSCQNTTIHWLEYPYESFICQKDDEDFGLCLDDCLREVTIKTFDRLPFAPFYTSKRRNLEMKFISNRMTSNRTVSLLMNKIYQQCSKQCPMKKCDYSYCIMIGHADTTIVLDGTDAGSRIRVESPGFPFVSITYVPQVPLLDTIIYILSSLGTWFGLVIISCNPLVLYYKVKMRRRNRTDLFLRRMMMRSNFYMQYATRRRTNERRGQMNVMEAKDSSFH